jgi:myosin heavy subunit
MELEEITNKIRIEKSDLKNKEHSFKSEEIEIKRKYMEKKTDLEEKFEEEKRKYDNQELAYEENILKEEKIKDLKAIIINHYAAEIKYNIKNIIIKNKSNSSESQIKKITDELSQSENKLIKEIFKEKEENEKRSLFTHFKDQLDKLFEIFEQSNNKFIKCIKTKNKEVKEKLFVPELVEEQMNYGGILEAIKIKKQGYSIRKNKNEFFEEYKILFPQIKDEVFNDAILNNMVELMKGLNDNHNPFKSSNIDLIKIGKKDNIFMRENLKRFLDNLKNKYLMINKFKKLIRRKELVTILNIFKKIKDYIKIVKIKHYIFIDWLKKKIKFEKLKK